MGLLSSFKRGMKKTRDFLSGGVNRLAGSLTRVDDSFFDDLEALMVQADFGITTTMTILDRLRARLRDLPQKDQAALLQALGDIWLELLGPARPLTVSPDSLTIFLMVGVNGTGKTTTAGKLAHRYRQQGLSVLMAAADTFRAAAIDQLKLWGERTDTAVVAHQVGSDPASVVFDALSAARARQTNVLIIDTAGRLHTKKNLMDELAKIHRVIQREAPQAQCETLLVLDATTGQNAVSQATVFHETTQLTGLVLTKLDGNAKGGIALAVANQTQTPIRLAGLGEGVEDLADFDPQAFVASLLPDPEEPV